MGYWIRSTSPFVLAALVLMYTPKPRHGPIEFSVYIDREPDRVAVVVCECGATVSAPWTGSTETFLQLLMEAWGGSTCVT